MRTTVRRLLPVAATAVFVSACADAPTSAVRFAPSLPSQHVVPIATPQRELLVLCKAGPVGTYTFDATATHPVLRNEAAGVHNLTAATYTIVVAPGSTIDVGGNIVPGACYNIVTPGGNHNHVAIAGGQITATVTVVESGIPAGIDFDHVVTYQNNAGTITSSSSTTNSASAQLGGVGGAATLGASMTFFNVLEPPPPPPTGNRGCTPGYWKQDHHFDSWPAAYTPGMSFNAVFGIGTNWFSNSFTLLDGLGANGGGKNALARHAVAALLNAGNGFYPQTTAAVIAGVQAAYANGTLIESTKNTFANNNELGCPLN